MQKTIENQPSNVTEVKFIHPHVNSFCANNTISISTSDPTKRDLLLQCSKQQSLTLLTIISAILQTHSFRLLRKTGTRRIQSSRLRHHTLKRRENEVASRKHTRLLQTATTKRITHKPASDMSPRKSRLIRAQTTIRACLRDPTTTWER